MPIEKKNFYQIFQDESPDFYIDEFDTIVDEFNDWVAKNFLSLGRIKSFKNVQPRKRVIRAFEKLGYIHKESQCHYSAKAITLLNKEYEYWTGFIHQKDFIYPIVTHSFNIYLSKIVDFSRIGMDLNNNSTNDLYFPHVYYGIKIPFEFVDRYREDVLNNYSMIPLLFEWYNEQKVIDK